MKAEVELVYDGNKPSRKLTVEVKGSPKGKRFLDAIDRAVEKAAGDDKEWRRWNLVSVDSP